MAERRECFWKRAHLWRVPFSILPNGIFENASGRTHACAAGRGRRDACAPKTQSNMSKNKQVDTLAQRVRILAWTGKGHSSSLPLFLARRFWLMVDGKDEMGTQRMRLMAGRSALSTEGAVFFSAAHPRKTREH